jgi:hypothetical protein
MSIRLYLKPGITKTQEPDARFSDTGEKPHFWPYSANFGSLKELDPSRMGNVEYLTIEESFWKELSGYSFVSGRYKGDGFDVEIGPSHFSNRGSDKKSFLDKKQEITGRFDTVQIAIAFWEALTCGEILPSRPLCRELTVTEQTYAKQAAGGVTAMAKLNELQSLVDQQANQLKHLAQLVQDYVLTPKATTTA